MNITVIGSGYVGLVAGACFAELGHDVVLVDNDLEKYSALAAGICPIFEAHLPELLNRHRGRRLVFSHDLKEAVRGCRAVFVSVGTPPTCGGEADLSYVESVAREIAQAVNDYKVIVGKSTVQRDGGHVASHGAGVFLDGFEGRGSLHQLSVLAQQGLRGHSKNFGGTATENHPLGLHRVLRSDKGREVLAKCARITVHTGLSITNRLQSARARTIGILVVIETGDLVFAAHRF